MSKKRILIVTSELVPFYYGGIGTQFKSLAALFKRHGHLVYILARKPANYDENLYLEHYGEVPLFFVNAPPVRNGMPQSFVYAAEVARRFDELYGEIRPDLVIAADFNAEAFFLFLQAATGLYDRTEFLLTINGMNYEIIAAQEGKSQKGSPGMMDQPGVPSLLAMEDLCVWLTPWIVSPTAGAWKGIHDRLGISKNVRIIPNLVDLSSFHLENEEDRREQGDPVILFIGRLDRIKGADLLLKAYFEIADQMDRAVPRIIFVGQDCYWKAYNSTFLKYWRDRIPEKYRAFITFVGQVSHDQIREYLRKATVCVFPSRLEIFGIVCLEALSMGCPVIVSKGTGLEEVLGPDLADQCAVSVTDDIQPLARKILSSLGETPQPLASKLRKRAREVVHQGETGWLGLIEDMDRKRRIEPAFTRSLLVPLKQLLDSLVDEYYGAAYLQLYFCRRGNYTESDSLRVPYAKNRWTTLNIPLPVGTGERPLRLDPTDAPGSIRIKELVLLNEAGSEIWRTDSRSNFEGCDIRNSAAMSIEDSCLVLRAKTNDPQLFLNCPTTDRPAEISVAIYVNDDLQADILHNCKNGENLPGHLFTDWKKAIFPE